MVINFFLTWFVSAAFIYMAASAWVRLAKIIGKNIGHHNDRTDDLITINDYSELIFTFCVAVTISIISIGLLWLAERHNKNNDNEKIEELLDAAEETLG